MFDSLSDQMKHDSAANETPVQRTLKLVAIVLVSVVLFGGLYFAVRMLE